MLGASRHTDRDPSRTSFPLPWHVSGPGHGHPARAARDVREPNGERRTNFKPTRSDTLVALHPGGPDASRPHGTLMELHSDCTHTYQLIHHTQSRYVDLFQIGSLGAPLACAPRELTSSFRGRPRAASHRHPEPPPSTTSHHSAQGDAVGLWS